jgi:hypothetical protein
MVRWDVPLTVPSGTYINVRFQGFEVRAYLQSKEDDGVWVQIDPDGPFRFILDADIIE